MFFDARVSGVADYCNLVRAALGRDEAQYQVRKMRAARDEIVRLLGSHQRKQVQAIFRKKHDTVSHLYIEKHSMLKPLQEWLDRRSAEAPPATIAPAPVRAQGTLTTTSDTALKAARVSSSSAQLAVVQTSSTASTASIPNTPLSVGFRALDALGLNDALIVPLALPKPLSLALPARSYRLPVVSAQALIEELDTLEKRLATAKAFGVPKVRGFMCCQASDVERLERLEGLNERFWVRFAAVILRHLAESAIQHGLVAHITDRPLLPKTSE
ncbi:MAG: hypothetical protein KDB07_09920 [Planctomycetes bacterium]|nr:hypothetical protein [Planctomycetota bacterium]